MRLRGAYSFLRRRTSAALASAGLSADQFVILTVLERNGPATQQELVARCSSDTNTVGAMLALLETRDLLTRTAHSADGRAWMVSLTRAGKALQKKAWNQSETLRGELADLFSPEETRILLKLLDRITDAMRPHSKRPNKPATEKNAAYQSNVRINQ